MTTTVSPAVLQAGIQITTTAVAYVTGAANSQTIIKRAVFSNVTGSAVTITVYRVPSGGAIASTNMIIDGRSIAGLGTDLTPELANMVLNAGDMIWAKSDTATAVNLFVSGFVAS